MLLDGTMRLSYSAGRHKLKIIRSAPVSAALARLHKGECAGYQWTVKVDAVLLPGTFVSAADAWAAGVRETDRVDRASRPDTGDHGGSPRSTESAHRTAHPTDGPSQPASP